MERKGASFRITSTLPGEVPNPQQRTQRLLKSAVTRTRNRVQSIESEYGARDIPASSPLHGKVTQARSAHVEALRAYGDHTRGI